MFFQTRFAFNIELLFIFFILLHSLFLFFFFTLTFSEFFLFFQFLSLYLMLSISFVSNRFFILLFTLPSSPFFFSFIAFSVHIDVQIVSKSFSYFEQVVRSKKELQIESFFSQKQNKKDKEHALFRQKSLCDLFFYQPLVFWS